MSNKNNLPIIRKNNAWYKQEEYLDKSGNTRIKKTKLYGLSISPDTDYIKTLIEQYNASLCNSDLQTVLFLDGFESASRIGDVQTLQKITDVPKKLKQEFWRADKAQERDVLTYPSFTKEFVEFELKHNPEIRKIEKAAKPAKVKRYTKKEIKAFEKQYFNKEKK
jgi:hypothetical protein